MQLIILDRDGVINRDSDDFIKSPQEWQPLPGSLEAIARLHQNGYRVVVVSNQSGLAREHLNTIELSQIHSKMHKAVIKAGGYIDAVFFCPHGPDENCNCRKPKPGLLVDISQRLRVPLKEVYFVGDRLSDVEAAKSAGAMPVLVRSGKELPERLPHRVPVFDNLADFANHLMYQPV